MQHIKPHVHYTHTEINDNYGRIKTINSVCNCSPYENNESCLFLTEVTIALALCVMLCLGPKVFQSCDIGRDCTDLIVIQIVVQRAFGVAKQWLRKGS